MMTAIADLLNAFNELRSHASQYIEESFRLTMEGGSLSGAVKASLQNIYMLTDQLNVEAPTLIISGETVDASELSESTFDEEPWRLAFGKTPLAQQMRARDDENTLLFFTIEGFHQWLERIDPFQYPTSNEPDLTRPTTIRVNGLTMAFGGPLLWVLPPSDKAPDVPTVGKLPNQAEVHGLIHTNAMRPLRVCPSSYALNWGELDSSEAAPMVRLSSRVLAACLVQELKLSDVGYETTLRGTKRLSLPLSDSSQGVRPETLLQLFDAVCWVYEERPETRLRLVMDRLSIDIEQGQTLLAGAEKYLAAALQQARDSYTFVILDRKDAYHKEVRELMKDMKSQADLYATKVRDLINALTRDILGVLVFIGFSFVGKFDQKNIQALLKSTELSVLVKFLACYLALSCVLQFASHIRDASLAYQESRTWLDVLQHYSSQSDKQDRFLTPIDRRRVTLFIAMGIIGAIYSVLFLITWNLPFFIELMLAQ
ncbi:TPA: hypothetical protein VDV13_002913 [Pseudomonas aeruginosa]|nr:hypothetical protein [Pseudomonas aeruginosa]HEP9114888.1 hypothetical protein [Pseudomonas aeruginosa]HEP9120214.1 hypothetical protein [Pseudomonas aeruginosa]HEP9131483.1 hypothetical protein [Pseudomonas aeruginosa]HEP9137571.1 hypothetical protein [Pseudomonas aeruginosa]